MRADKERNKTKDQQKIAEDPLIGFELAKQVVEKAQSDDEKAKLKFTEDKVLSEQASELFEQRNQSSIILGIQRQKLG